MINIPQMVEYLELVEEVLTKGKQRQGPKPEGTLSVFGMQARYNVEEDGFPLVTTRDLSWSWRKIIVPELLWMMSGSTNAYDLHQYGSNVWDKWAEAAHDKLGYENGELGPIYGHQLRSFNGRVDQLTQVGLMLRRLPQTRRAMISFWNLEDVEDMAGNHVVDVAPCITLLHFAQVENKLDLHMVQRSADLAIGVPHDVAEYALLLMLMAHEVGMPAGTLIHTLSDAHIYENQIPAMKELLTRAPLPRPTVTIADSPSGTLYDHRVDDFQLNDYHSHPRLSIPVAL